MCQRLIRLILAAVSALGLSFAAGPMAHAAPRLSCGKSDFCLFEGPHQTGKVLYKVHVTFGQGSFDFPTVDDIEPPIHPLSARNPLLDEFGCVVRLDDLPNFAGNEQELDAHGDAELSGARVASITDDCG